MGIKNRILTILKQLDKYSPKPSLYSFIMSKDEKALFDQTIRDAKVYLEFGMGGSTFRTLQKSKARIYSIDSSTEWIKLMREYLIIKYMEKRRLSLFHVDIGPTKEWGHPVDDQSRALFPDYSGRIFSLIKKETVDTVLVDGRFRVACTLKTIMECHSNKDLKIIIHDFWNREYYHAVLKYLVEIARADTLGVFRVNPDLDLTSLNNDYDHFKYEST